MNRRAIPILAVAALAAGLAMTSPAASARDAAPPVPNADTDGDKIFENLSARLEKLGTDDRLSVIVRLSGDLTDERIAALESTVGEFELTRSLPIVDGFTATMTKAQAEAVARLSSVASVEENGVVRGLNDSAQASFGVTKARADVPGLDGDTDGKPAVYSRRDLVVAVVDSGIDATHPQLDDGKVLAFVDCSHHRTAPDPATCFDARPVRRQRPRNAHRGHDRRRRRGRPEVQGGRSRRRPRRRQGAACRQYGDAGGIVSGIQWVVENRHRYGIEAINISLGGNRCSRRYRRAVKRRRGGDRGRPDRRRRRWATWARPPAPSMARRPRRTSSRSARWRIRACRSPQIRTRFRASTSPGSRVAGQRSTVASSPTSWRRASTSRRRTRATATTEPIRMSRTTARAWPRPSLSASRS